MTRILIAGLKEPPGGVESAVLAYTDNFSHSEITADFAFICGEISFSDRIKNGKALYLPNRIKHPLLYRRRLREIFAEGNYDALWCNYSGLTNIDFLKAAKKYGVTTRIIHAHTSRHSWGNALMKYLVPYFHNKNQKKVEKYTTAFWACSKKSAEFTAHVSSRFFVTEKSVRINTVGDDGGFLGEPFSVHEFCGFF